MLADPNTDATQKAAGSAIPPNSAQLTTSATTITTLNAPPQNALAEPSLDEMNVVVEDDEDCLLESPPNPNRWMLVHHRHRAFASMVRPTHSPAFKTTDATSNDRISPSPLRQQFIPTRSPLPPSDIKIVLRPRGGLNLTRISPLLLASLLQQQAHLPPNHEDQLRLHYRSNFIVVSTPYEDRAQRYASLTTLSIEDKTYALAAHVPAPTNTCAVVISGLPLDLPPEEAINTLIEHNPHLQIIDARRMGSTPLFQITFNGTRVPYWVRYQMVTFRCRPAKRKTEACHLCWATGHRPDVCPNPDAPPRCPTCGLSSPPDQHICRPLCIVCSGPHPTGSPACTQRYRPRPPPRKDTRTFTLGQDIQNSSRSQSDSRTTTSSNKTSSNAPQKNFPPLSTEQQQRVNHPKQHHPPSLQNGRGGSDATTPQTGPPKAPKATYAQVSSHHLPATPTSYQPRSPANTPDPILHELQLLRQEVARLRAENAQLRANPPQSTQPLQLPQSAPTPNKKRASESPDQSPQDRVTHLEEQLKEQNANIAVLLDTVHALTEQTSRIKSHLETLTQLLPPSAPHQPISNGQPNHLL